MKKFLLLLFVFAVSLLAYSPAQAIVHVEGRYWFTNLDAKLQVTESAVAGTNIDTEKNLAVDDKDNFWEAQVRLELGSHKLRYSYMPLSWSGETNILQSIKFAGQTYASGTKVTSNLDAIYQRIGYRYDILDADGSQFGIIFLDIKVVDVQARLRSSSADASYSETVIMPTIGLSGQVGLPFFFSIGAEATGLGYQGSQILDVEAHLNFTPFPYAAILGGYRIFDMKLAADGEDKIDLRLRGPFMMVKIGF